MTRPRDSRLSAFRKDLDRLAREAEELAESFSEESRIVREEAVGAELLATRDLVAHVGIFWDTVEQLGDLAGRQARQLARDYATTLSELAGLSGTVGGTGADRAGAVFGSHVDRRMSHIAQGLDEGLEVVSTQSGRACDALFKLWSPFLSVVRQDWTRPRQRADT